MEVWTIFSKNPMCSVQICTQAGNVRAADIVGLSISTTNNSLGLCSIQIMAEFSFNISFMDILHRKKCEWFFSVIIISEFTMPQAWNYNNIIKRRQMLQTKTCSADEMKFINLIFPVDTFRPTVQVISN